MCKKLQHYNLIQKLEQAQTAGLIRYYTPGYATWGAAYEPYTTVYIQLHDTTANATIDKLCEHIEQCYHARIWNREYVNKSITVAYIKVDYGTTKMILSNYEEL